MEQDNREAWLTAAVDAMSGVFAEKGYPLPDKLRVSLGWPMRARQWAGCCHAETVSKGGYIEVFISPLFDNPLRVLSVLTHELCHAAVGVQQGHNRAFAACAKAMGLEGSPAKAEGLSNPEWLRQARGILKLLGPLPHHGLVLPEPEKKQTTRMRKQSCVVCGFVIRTAQSWVDKVEQEGHHLRCPDSRCRGFLK